MNSLSLTLLSPLPPSPTVDCLGMLRLDWKKTEERRNVKGDLGSFGRTYVTFKSRPLEIVRNFSYREFLR